MAYSSELFDNDGVFPHKVIVGYTERAALPDANLERNEASCKSISLSLYLIPNKHITNAYGGRVTVGIGKFDNEIVKLFFFGSQMFHILLLSGAHKAHESILVNSIASICDTIVNKCSQIAKKYKYLCKFCKANRALDKN